MKKSYSFKRNQTFYIREGWITKALMAIDSYGDNPSSFFGKDNHGGADLLGVGSAMASSIRYWMRVTGLLFEGGKKGQILSDFGKLVLEKDPYLEDMGTLWMLHLNTTVDYGEATVWNLFFNQVHTGMFEKYAMQKKMQEQFRLEQGFQDDSDYAVGSFENDFNVLLHSYTLEEKSSDPEERLHCPFSELGILSKHGERYYKEKGDESKINFMIFLYALLLYLKEKIASQKTQLQSLENSRIAFNIEELCTGKNSPGKLLGLSRAQVNDYLDILEKEQYLSVSRTAGLDMVYLENHVFFHAGQDKEKVLKTKEEFLVKHIQEILMGVAEKYYEVK